MSRRRRKLVALVILGVALLGIASLTTTASDEGDPFPCDPVCVPVPYFPFLLCAPGCPDPGAPGP